MLQLITNNVEIIKDLVNKMPFIHYNVWYQSHLDGVAVHMQSPIGRNNSVLRSLFVGAGL